MRVPWTARRSNQSILKEISPGCSGLGRTDIEAETPILWHSAFFTVQISHPYITTGKTIALTRWIFVGKVMSLLFNMLSMFVIAFLPRSKYLLISWLQSPSAVTLEPKNGIRCHDLSFSEC